MILEQKKKGSQSRQAAACICHSIFQMLNLFIAFGEERRAGIVDLIFKSPYKIHKKNAKGDTASHQNDLHSVIH